MKYFSPTINLLREVKILGLLFDRDLSFKTHAAIISASKVNFWKETSILIPQGLNPFYAVSIFDSNSKTRVWYCMTIWFHQNMTSLDKMCWNVLKSIFGKTNYQVPKHVVSVLSNIWLPPLLYTKYYCFYIQLLEVQIV